MVAHTMGDWHVMPGHEQDFVDSWREIAARTNTRYGEGGWGILLRSEDDPRHFISIGAWSDERAIQEWRASEDYREAMETLRVSLEGMEFKTLERVSEVGHAPTTV